MRSLVLIVVSLVFLLNIQSSEEAESNKQRTFIDLSSSIPCIRRFNATHQIGCGKRDQGDYDGIVYAIRTSQELNRLKNIQKLNGNRKLVLAVLPYFYKSAIDYYLTSQGRELVNGIVLLAALYDDKSFNYTSPDAYSPNSKSPNNEYGLYANESILKVVEWNSRAGNSFAFNNFDVPIYVMTSNDDVKQLLDGCYDKFNRQVFERVDKKSTSFSIGSTDLLCGMRLGIEMSGAISSKVCIRRANIIHTLDFNSFCDPLGGSNYFTFLSQKPSNELPIILLSARMDAFTMFEYYTPAANEPKSSLIGMLSLVELLATHRTEFTLANLLFVLFDNEALDYGGSSKFTDDLAKNIFPTLLANTSSGPIVYQLKKDNITTMIELSQLGSIGLNDSNPLYIHKDPISFGNNSTIKNIIQTLQNALSNYSNKAIRPVTNINQSLPPASLHSFLRNEINIGGIVVGDYETMYTNNHYHSVFDTPESLNIVYPSNMSEAEAVNTTTKFAKRLQTMMTSIAQTLHQLYANKSIPFNDKVNLGTINRLCYCFYANASCSYLRGLMSNSQWNTYQNLLDSIMPKQHLSFYTGVDDNAISGKWLIHILMRYFTRSRLFENFNETECHKDSESVHRVINQTELTVRSFTFVHNYMNEPNRTLCIASVVYAVSSVSPAFDQYNDGVLIDTHKYSAWTESSWTGKDKQMRLFMFTSDAVKHMTIAIGIIVLIVSFIVTYFVNKYSTKLFPYGSPEQADEIIREN